MNFEFSDKANYQEFFGRAHNMVRRSVKNFVDKEIIPCVDEWEEMGEFPQELYKKSGDVGLLGIGYPGLSLNNLLFRETLMIQKLI